MEYYPGLTLIRQPDLLIMDTFFLILTAIILLQSLLALGGTLMLLRFSLRKRQTGINRYQPKAVVIVPCKGLEHDFEENIKPLLNQEYRDYEIIFVTESEKDPAYAVLSKMIRQSRRAAWLVVAGQAKDQGQKVHNLCAAIDMLNTIDRRAEVLIFADSDARATRQWLSDLVAPLGDKRVGATTGFRWFVSHRSNPASVLLSVWNSSALSLLGENSGFTWGGSTAIRRENFEKLAIKRRWQGALSDDYVVTAAIREAGQRITFVPNGLLASFTNASLAELLEFTTRQMRITRVYSPKVWIFTGITHGLFNLAFWGGISWMAVSGLRGHFNPLLASLTGGIFLLGAINGAIRHSAAVRMMAPQGANIRRNSWAFLLLGPVASLLYLFNVIQSAGSKRITWRGIDYEMLSPHQTRILHRARHRSPNDPSSKPSGKTRASVRSSTQKQ